MPWGYNVCRKVGRIERWMGDVYLEDNVDKVINSRVIHQLILLTFPFPFFPKFLLNFNYSALPLTLQVEVSRENPYSGLFLERETLTNTTYLNKCSPPSVQNRPCPDGLRSSRWVADGGRRWVEVRGYLLVGWPRWHYPRQCMCDPNEALYIEQKLTFVASFCAS